MSLVLEMKARGGWRALGSVPAGETGSCSHNTPQGRHIVLFSCHGDFSVIERSAAGVDVEQGPLRVISSEKLEEVAQLLPGEAFELWLKTDRMDHAALFRFRHEDGS